MMHGWGWSDWQIRQALPRVLRVFVGVGLLQEVGGAFLPTSLIESDEAWDKAWEILEKEGIAGPTGS